MTKVLGAGVVGGGLNSYYVFRRGGTLTDMTYAYFIGWSVSFFLTAPGFGESGVAQMAGGDYLGYALQGMGEAYTTNVATQGYLAIKRKDIKEFNLYDLGIVTATGFLLGGLDAYGLPGTALKGGIGAIALTIDWQKHTEEYKEYYDENVEEHVPWENYSNIKRNELLTGLSL